MKNIKKGLGLLGMIAIINAPTLGLLTHNVIVDNNPTVLETRAMNYQEEQNVFDDIWEAINMNSEQIALNSGSISQLNTDFINLLLRVNANTSGISNVSNEVDGILDEMLFVDRYDTTCWFVFDDSYTFETTFKHHYDANFEVEYWKFSGFTESFIFGDKTSLQLHLLQNEIICNL